MIEYIAKFFFKRAVLALITRTILKFDITNSSLPKIELLIKTLQKEIETTTREENTL